MRAFLFDMDGTIVDSLADIAGAMNHVLGELGLGPHPEGEYRRMVGEGAASLVARALPADRGDLHADALARYHARYRVELVNGSRPYDGVRELLAALAARGERLGVVTNKPQRPADEIVARAFAPGTFGVVIGEIPTRARKPDAAPALAAAEALGASPRDCVFVGDSAIDVATAHAAGMTSVGVLWGFRDREELEGAGARHIVRVPADILAL